LEDVFVGRETEVARFAQVVERVQRGEPWLVTVEGESGIGKTALVRRCLPSSTGRPPLWARADPSESDAELGVVGQLLRGVEDRILRRYPLLRREVDSSSSFAVGAQMLGVVGDLQADGPVVLVVDDMQWADSRSAEALSFMLRRLSADSVLMVAVVRGDRDHLDEPTRRALTSVERRLRLRLAGLRLDDVGPLAAALGAAHLPSDILQRLYDSTGGHALYLQTLLIERDTLLRVGPGAVPVSASLAAVIADQLVSLPEEARSLLEMLAVLNARTPLALLGDAAQVASPSAAIEPAVRAGLVDWWPHDPTFPVVLRHPLQRDAIYGRLSAARRRDLHARAVPVVDQRASWLHRVASLDRPDEDLATQLERLAGEETAKGHMPLAATHLQWASGVSPDPSERERRLLLAAWNLVLTDENRALGLRPAVEDTAPSALRNGVLGTMALTSGRLKEAEVFLAQALAEARQGSAGQGLMAVIASRLAFAYALLGAGQKVLELGRWARGTGVLDAATESRVQAVVAIGMWQTCSPGAALAELAHLDPDPARVDAVHSDSLLFRGLFQLAGGDLARALADLSVCVRLARNGAVFTVGMRAYYYCALAQYLSGAWDDALLSAEQGAAAADIHPRRYEIPLLHLAAAGVLAGRGQDAEAEHRASLAEEAAGSLDYDQERLYAGMARAFVCQAAEDYAGMVSALGRWQDDTAVDDRARTYGVFWRPLLVEGLLGSGRAEEGATVLRFLREQADQGSYVQPALAWLEGWLAEQRGAPETARTIYQHGEETASQDSPVYFARLLLAHGRLMRRTGQRRAAVELLRRANDMYRALEAAPFVARAEQELAACGLPQAPTQRRSVLEMTSRESEVARLVAQRRTNNEIAAELFVTTRTVEYHLGNIYAKFGVKGRQQLRRALAGAGSASAV
jgi:DNA-binding CsgD family transcriptional regulator